MYSCDTAVPHLHEPKQRQVHVPCPLVGKISLDVNLRHFLSSDNRILTNKTNNMNIIDFHKQEIKLYAVNATLSDCAKDEHDMYGALGMSDEARSLMDETNKFKVRTLRLKRITKSKNINNESYEIWADCYYDNKLDAEHIFCEYYVKCHGIDYYIDSLLINHPNFDVDLDNLKEKNDLKLFLLNKFNDFNDCINIS